MYEVLNTDSVWMDTNGELAIWTRLSRDFVKVETHDGVHELDVSNSTEVQLLGLNIYLEFRGMKYLSEL